MYNKYNFFAINDYFEFMDLLILICMVFFLKAPNPPNGLQVVVVNRTLTLNWTSPQLNMFKAETYKISYTCNDWEDNCEMIVNATNSSCIIPNVLPEKTYKFKIASCLQTSYVGKPSVEILYYSECKCVEMFKFIYIVSLQK